MPSLVDDVSVTEKLAKVHIILKMWKIKMIFVCFLNNEDHIDKQINNPSH